MGHCTKGQVGNVSPRMAKRIAAPRRLVRRLDIAIAEDFKQLLFKQVAGRRVRIKRQART
jgi:hypothetical protein